MVLNHDLSLHLPEICAPRDELLRPFDQSITAGLLLEQNKPDDALLPALAAYNAVSEAASREAASEAASEAAFCVSIGLADIYLLKGETEKCREVIGKTRDFIEKNEALLKDLQAYETRISLWDGNRKAAEEWLRENFVNDTAFDGLHRICQDFTTVRAYIVLSDFPKAQAVLKELLDLGQTMNRPLDAAEAGVLLAITEWITGKRKDACDRLQGLLAVLAPNGFVRVVANEGKSVVPILKAIIKKMDLEPEKDEAVYRFTKEVYVAAYEQSGRFSGLTSGLDFVAAKLSKKQAYVLRLLAIGHSNAEIVKISGLSINTIKTHTKLVYQKLNVTNVLDAIIAGKRRGIIS